ncbi:uncharacterized protein TNCV_3984221 [Trichonephila clavipes]|nr:uncharacterized protein TNCV_3984221 [Trichonephila clavipes]
MERRYYHAAETRNNLVAASQNLQGAHGFLPNIAFPYCGEDEVETLNKKNSLVNVALYHIHHIWHYRIRLRESGQPIGRLSKTCKNAFPRTIPVSFGRLDTPIATESSLNVHFFKFLR